MLELLGRKLKLLRAQAEAVKLTCVLLNELFVRGAFVFPHTLALFFDLQHDYVRVAPNPPHDSLRSPRQPGDATPVPHPRGHWGGAPVPARGAAQAGV